MQERQRCDYACSESLAAAYSLHSVYLQILVSSNCYAMVDGYCQLTWMEILWREKEHHHNPAPLRSTAVVNLERHLDRTLCAIRSLPEYFTPISIYPLSHLYVSIFYAIPTRL